MDVAQTAAFIQSITYENSALEHEDFPKTEEPVYILGKQYSVLYDLDDIKLDVLSRLWFTYRKGFSAIGGTGPTCDTGWGCMLRCGQMMIAQALVIRHLGRDWRWSPDRYDPKYHEILRMFLDKKGSPYSIHQIASMGVSEGKSVGEWFGPNTIAQVLRKLAIYDEWSNVAIHVALDNTVIMEDIWRLCKIRSATQKESPVVKPCVSNRQKGSSSKRKKSSKQRIDKTLVNGTGSPDRSCSDKFDANNAGASSDQSDCEWKPLLLIIPLRLGLSEINCVYENALKVCLTLKQSVGIIGGKPNHAHYFIGYLEDEMVYLDPHTTHPVVNFTMTGESDDSYHCPFSSRMKISQLDPSIAVGFYCGTEADFNDWCLSVQKFIIKGQKAAMFELHEKRPNHWPVFEPYSPRLGNTAEFHMVDDRHYDTDEEFELL